MPHARGSTRGEKDAKAKDIEDQRDARDLMRLMDAVDFVDGGGDARLS